jgi:hypothetical protein
MNTFTIPDGCTCITQQGLTLLREMQAALELEFSPAAAAGGGGGREEQEEEDALFFSPSTNAAAGGIGGDFHQSGAASRVRRRNLLDYVKQLEQAMAASQRQHEIRYAELMRLYVHYINVWSVRAPPDEGPELQTVPWHVGRFNTTVAPKGELSKRTADAPPTVQKPVPKEKGKGKRNKKKE